MTIQDLGSLGELIAALATIATLVYLATQIKQNTNQLKGESIREINTAERELTQNLRDDAELISIVMKSLFDWESITAKQQARAHLYIHSYVRWLETCWNLCEQKALDRKIYNSRELFIIGMLGQEKGGRVWWEMWKPSFDPEFAADLDKSIAAQGNSIPFILNAPFYAAEHWVDKVPSKNSSELDA